MGENCLTTKKKFFANYKLYHISAAIFSLLSIMIAQCAKTGTIGIVANYLFKVSFLCLVIGNLIVLIYRDELTHKLLYTIVFGVFFLFFFLSMIKYSGEEPLTLNAYLGLVAVSFTFFLGLAEILKTINVLTIIDIIKKNIVLILICGIFTLLFFPNYNVWQMIDSHTYYNAVVEEAGKWNFDILGMNHLLMGGHTAYAFAILLHIGELLCPYYGYGQTTIKLLMSIITIVLFYKICYKLWGEKNKLYILLLTGIFAFSPLFLGISYLTSTDFPLLCFMTTFVFSYIYENRALKWISVLAVCFSKEIGIIIVFGFYMGEFLYTLIENKDTSFSLKKIVSNLFDYKRLQEYSAVFCYAFILLFGSAGWIKNLHRMFETSDAVEMATEKTYIWWHYPIYKIFESFFMNFYWIIFPVIILCIVARKVYQRKNKDLEGIAETGMQKNVLLPICSAYIFFCVCGIAYFTYIHYRYIQLQQLFYVLLLGFFVLNICPDIKWLRKSLLILVGLLFLIESYITVDPVTYFFFDHLDIGNGQVVSTRKYWYIITDEESGDGYYWEPDRKVINQFYLAEGTEYNRETLGLQRMLERAIEAIDYNENKMIILDNFGGWMENTNGQLFGVMSCNGYWWDQKKGTVTRQQIGIPLNLTVDQRMFETDNYEEIYYFDFPFNQFHKNDVLDKYTILSEQAITYGKWKMKVYKVK